MLKAEIQSYFARLSPLPLTLSEKVRLTNSQLVPALAYRLITHSLSPNQLEKLQSLIWAGLASRSITRLVSPKDRFAALPKGGLGMKFLPHSVHVATVNYGLRALCGLAPKSVGPLYVQSLLSSNQRASDPVQNSFMDPIHALGISFHSIGPWKPTAIRDLMPGTQLTVRFKSGQATGRVTEATSKWANVSFHDGVYSVDTHTSYTMHMPCHAVMNYSRPSHFQLVPEFLRRQKTIPKPPAPPHNAHALGISQHGHLFAPQAQHYLGKRSLDEWGCHGAAEALTRPPTPGLQRVWLYSDGSSGESGHAAAVTAFLPDGTTRVLCLSSPHPSSLGSEFWGLGWVGLGQGLAWSPTHGPRRLPCGTRLGGRTRVSGHKAYRTVDRPQTPRWRSRAGDAAVPVCMCPCVSEGGGGGAVAHLLAPLLFGVGAHGAGKCVPGAPGPGREAGEPDAEPAGGDVGLGSQPPRHKDMLPTPRLPIGTGRRWYVARLGSDPHSLTALGTGGAASRAGSGSHGRGRTLGRWRGTKAQSVLPCPGCHQCWLHWLRRYSPRRRGGPEGTTPEWPLR